MVNKIRNLAIDGFRGASRLFTLEFDSAKPITLIFGENGTGKSTLVDAIECIANGSTSFKDAWKLGRGQRKDSHFPTIGKKPDEVSIAIEYDNKKFQTSSTNTKANIPTVHVLRRRTLQSYIEADAAERYRVVAQFMDIPLIEAAEGSLRDAHKNSGKAVELASSAIAQAEEGLNDQWEAAGSPGLGKEYKSAEDWAGQESNADSSALEQANKEHISNIAVIEKLNRAAESVLARRAELKQAQQANKSAVDELKAVEQQAAKGSAKLSTLLRDAKSYLEASPVEICPVCEETKIAAPELIQRLSQRLQEMVALNHAQDAATKTTKILQDKQSIYQQAVGDLLKSTEAALVRYGDGFAKSGQFIACKDNDTEKATEIALILNQELSQKLVKLREVVQATQRKLHTLTGIRQFVKTLDSKRAEYISKGQLHDSLTKALKIVEDKRKSYIEKVLVEIGQSVDALYQQIHPGESIGNLKLQLNAQERASLDYAVNFEGNVGVHPQPYYSESHLDTLGLCIFLVLAKRSSGNDAIVVLDDVLGSVDQQHMDATVRMLINDSSQFAQIIITTHYRQMRDRFRFTHGSSVVQLLELKPWTLAGGIRIGRTLEYRDELRSKLQSPDFDRQAVASQAGILFEGLLEFVSLAYKCKVPHIPVQEYTFGDVANAPNNKLKSALKIVRVNGDSSHEIPLKTFYDRLREAIQVRNIVGCHFNKWGADLADADVRSIAELAVEFADTLICKNCGKLPVNSKSGSHWDCGGTCKHTEMHPLQQPE